MVWPSPTACRSRTLIFLARTPEKPKNSRQFEIICRTPVRVHLRLKFSTVLVPGGPTDTAFFPPGMPKPPKLIDPQVMAVPVVWMCSPAADSMTGLRLVARDWDHALAPDDAAASVCAPAGWPSLAETAQSARGVAI